MKQPAANLGKRPAIIMDRQEMVARQLADSAGKARRAIRHEEFGLADTGRVPEDLARRGVTRGVFVSHTQIIVAEWYPSRFTAPASLDELSLEGEARLEGSGRAWCAFTLERCCEDRRTDSYRQSRHGSAGFGGASRVSGIVPLCQPETRCSQCTPGGMADHTGI